MKDQFTWNRERGLFVLNEEPALIDSPIFRGLVQAHRVAEGWGLIATVRVREETDSPGVIDLWSRAGLELR